MDETGLKAPKCTDNSPILCQWIQQLANGQSLIGVHTLKILVPETCTERSSSIRCKSLVQDSWAYVAPIKRTRL